MESRDPYESYWAEQAAKPKHPTPEPESYGLFVFGFALLIYVLRKLGCRRK